MQALALDLVQRQVAVIVTTGGETSAVAAKAATTTIPIVFNTGTDPVRLGLVASLARPGGNATGVNIFTTELAEKRLGLLLDVVPAEVTIAILLNPNFAPALANGREAEAAARAVGKEIVVFNAANESEIDTAFAGVAQLGSRARLSAPTHTLTAGASKSWRWPRVMLFRPSTNGASLPKPEA